MTVKGLLIRCLEAIQKCAVALNCEDPWKSGWTGWQCTADSWTTGWTGWQCTASLLVSDRPCLALRLRHKVSMLHQLLFTMGLQIHRRYGVAKKTQLQERDFFYASLTYQVTIRSFAGGSFQFC